MLSASGERTALGRNKTGQEAVHPSLLALARDLASADVLVEAWLLVDHFEGDRKSDIRIGDNCSLLNIFLFFFLYYCW